MCGYTEKGGGDEWSNDLGKAGQMKEEVWNQMLIMGSNANLRGMDPVLPGAKSSWSRIRENFSSSSSGSTGSPFTC